jgi:hypothetical protein
MRTIQPLGLVSAVLATANARLHVQCHQTSGRVDRTLPTLYTTIHEPLWVDDHDCTTTANCNPLFRSAQQLRINYTPEGCDNYTCNCKLRRVPILAGFSLMMEAYKILATNHPAQIRRIKSHLLGGRGIDLAVLTTAILQRDTKPPSNAGRQFTHEITMDRISMSGN